MITIMDAIRSLATGASYTIVDNQINWFSPDIPQPTQAEIDAEIARLQAEQDATQYQRDRQAEYPSVDELVVAMWEAVVEERMASVTTLEGIRQSIKTKYPKG